MFYTLIIYRPEKFTKGEGFAESSSLYVYKYLTEEQLKDMWVKELNYQKQLNKEYPYYKVTIIIFKDEDMIYDGVSVNVDFSQKYKEPTTCNWPSEKAERLRREANRIYEEVLNECVLGRSTGVDKV